MGDLRWEPAGSGALQMDAAGNVWNSGHVNAVVPTGTGVMVAADTGGVWAATDSGTATPLGDWEGPDLSSLVRGPDGDNHYFAGGGLGISLSAPEVVVTSDALHAFAVGHDHALYHYSRVGGAWSAPESLGQDVVGPPAVCSWGGTRIDVFVVGTDGGLWHKWWDGRAWGPSPLGYEPLGGVCVGQPAAVAWGADRLDVFVVGTDGALWHKWWDGHAWGPSPTGWEPLGGSLQPSPVAIARGTGRLDVFCLRRGDRTLLHKRYDGGWLPSTTGFDSLGVVANLPAATSPDGTAIHLCAPLADGSLGHKRWDGTQWLPSTTGWAGLGAPPARFITAPSVASWGPSRLDVVCVDATGTLQHKWLDGTTWGPSATGWEAMGPWVAGHPNIAAPAANRLDIVINGDDGRLFWKSYAGGWTPSVGGWNALPSPMTVTLHETDVNASAPLATWRDVATPHDMGRIHCLLVAAARRRILAGCDGGLWWSPIPAAAARGAGYAWSRVPGLPPGGVSGLAATGDDTFVVAMWGSDVGNGTYGLFAGRFDATGPSVRRSNVAGADPRWMARTSVASSQATPSTVYAVGSDVWYDHVYTEVPDAIARGTAAVDLFARGPGSDCQHLGFDGTTWRWESLDGIFLGTPRAVSWGPNRLDVFGIGTDRALYHRAWNGSAWSAGWERRGGTCLSDPAVCSWGPDRIDVFVVGTDGGLYHQWWDGSSWGPGPGSFEPLGGRIWGQPYAIAPAPNRIDVYAIGADGALMVRRWDGTRWVDWLRLGDAQAFYPTAVAGGGGVVDVFCSGRYGNVLHKRWDGSAWLPSPTTFEDLGGVTRGGVSAIRVGATLEVYVRGTDNQVWVNTAPAGGGAWSGWAARGGNALGTPPNALMSAPRAVTSGSGRRDVFVKVPQSDGTGTIWDLWSTSAAPAWAGRGGTLRPGVAPHSIYTFLRSTDGGATFVSTAMYMPDHPNHSLDIGGGNQGFYNNCVTAKPTDARAVALGWRGGPYVSADAGETWRRIDSSSGHTHGDVHAVVYDASGTRLYSGSDGGVAVTADNGASWRSMLNRGLRTLQVYGGGIVAFSASYQVDGLVVAGLQDNGDVSCRTGAGEPWRQFMNSDGGITLCLRTGQILYTNNMDPRVSVFRYGGSGAKVPLTVPKPPGSPDTQGLACSPHIVNAPVYANGAGELMMAVGTNGNDLYGAFSRSDGGNLHWEYIGSIAAGSAYITCTGSGDGRVIFCGFNDGRIAAFDTASRTATFHTIYAGKDGPGFITRLLMHDTGYAFALSNRGPNGVVLRFQGGVWERVTRNLPLERFWGITTDWTVNPKTMYVSTDSRVYQSADRGESWQRATVGLPVRAHLNELDFALDSAGRRWLYVATWGRSIYRSPVT